MDNPTEEKKTHSNYGSAKNSDLIKGSIGETYEKNSKVQQEVIFDFFSNSVKPRIKPNDRILDLGCGTGLTSQKFLPLVGEGGLILGSDISEGMIKKAKSKEEKNLKFVVADAVSFHEEETIQKVTEGFDVIFSSYMLHWVKEKRTVFQRVREKLKSGGLFIATLVVILSPESATIEIVNEAADFVMGEKSEHIEAYFELPQDIEKMLEEEGLEKVMVNVRAPNITFRGKTEEELKEKIIDHFKTVVTIAANEPETRQKVLQEIARRLIVIGKPPAHPWSKILIGGTPVNYYVFEETDGEKLLKLRIEVIEFIYQKK